MKIYFAGTASRKSMGLNERLKVKNHLESYFVFMKKDQKEFFETLLEIDEVNNESKNK